MPIDPNILAAIAQQAQVQRPVTQAIFGGGISGGGARPFPNQNQQPLPPTQQPRMTPTQPFAPPNMAGQPQPEYPYAAGRTDPQNQEIMDDATNRSILSAISRFLGK